MTTTIYSCGCGLTSKELAVICQGQGWLMFPELTGLDDSQNFITIPRHPSELLLLLSELTGKTFVTVSEHLILMFLQEVRNEHMRPNDLRLYCVDRSDFEHNHPPGRRIMVDTEGELIDSWPGGFFHERMGLLF